ncbi:MAG: phosphatidate cytidylyltransferase [Candidatus Binataceae bacterium]
MLQTRLWTALVALPVTLAIVLYAPAPEFRWFIALLSAWGLYEVGEMTSAGVGQAVLLAMAGGVPAGVLLFANVYDRPDSWLGAAIVVVAMLMLVARVAESGGDSIMGGTPLVILGALWVGVLFPYFAILRNSTDGVPLVILMLLLVVASDSGAYFVGRFKGRIKLLPTVSPNKTVEGAVGGLAGCIIVGLLLRALLVPRWSWGSLALLSALIGVLAQLGDLAGSAFKRIAGVKDSGWIFPGHGGLLDRTCSLVFVAVLTYYYSR